MFSPGICWSGLILNLCGSEVHMRAACSSRRLGRQRERRVRCGRSSCESAPAAVRGIAVAAVATARKLAVLIWHLLSKGESYVWVRAQRCTRGKLRDLELESGVQGRAWPKRCGPRVQYQEPSRSGAQMGRARRDGLRALRLRLESAWAQAGAHGRRNRGATMKAARQGLRLAPCSSPRGHPCARGK